MAHVTCKHNDELTNVYILETINDDKLYTFEVRYRDKSTTSRKIAEILLSVDVFHWLFDRSLHDRLLNIIKEEKNLNKLDIVIIPERDLPTDDPGLLALITKNIDIINRGTIM